MSDSSKQTSLDTAIEQIEDWYRELQKPFSFREYQDTEIGKLVDGTANRRLPIHRWFNLKEAYSASLPMWVVDHVRQKYGISVSSVLDPFVGGGTTGVSLAQAGLDVIGVEYNPFIQFVARTKSHYPDFSKEEVVKAAASVELALPTSTEIPGLSTFSNPKYFNSSDVSVLSNAIHQVRHLDCNEITKDFLCLGVAAAIDDVANLRKDGRALRYIEKPGRPTAGKAITARWDIMLDDLGKPDCPGNFKVYGGTALDLDTVEIPSGFDMVLYSPPYLNTFDYSEVYKLELWLLGFITNSRQWQNLRLATIRSHPSIKFPDTSRIDNDTTMADIASGIAQLCDAIALTELQTKREMKKVVQGYFDDMYLALQQQWTLLRPGGVLVYVVANSRHKWLPIATDMILAAIAEKIGFEPLEVAVLRKRNGRTRRKTYLRESTVFMVKP